MGLDAEGLSIAAGAMTGGPNKARLELNMIG